MVAISILFLNWFHSITIPMSSTNHQGKMLWTFYSGLPNFHPKFPSLFICHISLICWSLPWHFNQYKHVFQDLLRYPMSVWRTNFFPSSKCWCSIFERPYQYNSSINCCPIFFLFLWWRKGLIYVICCTCTYWLSIVYWYYAPGSVLPFCHVLIM